MLDGAYTSKAMFLYKSVPTLEKIALTMFEKLTSHSKTIEIRAIIVLNSLGMKSLYSQKRHIKPLNNYTKGNQRQVWLGRFKDKIQNR